MPVHISSLFFSSVQRRKEAVMPPHTIRIKSFAVFSRCMQVIYDKFSHILSPKMYLKEEILA